MPPVAPKPVIDRPKLAEPMQVSESVVVSEGAAIDGVVRTEYELWL